MNKDINHLILFCDEMIARDVYTKEFQDIKDILKDYDASNKLLDSNKYNRYNLIKQRYNNECNIK